MMRPISNISEYHVSRNNLKLYKRSEATVKNNITMSEARMVSDRKRLQSAKFLQSKQSPGKVQPL